MAQNKTLELSIKIAGKVDKSLTTAINQTNTLTVSYTHLTLPTKLEV